MWARARMAGRTSVFRAAIMLVVLAMLGLGGLACHQPQQTAQSHDLIGAPAAAPTWSTATPFGQAPMEMAKASSASPSPVVTPAKVRSSMQAWNPIQGGMAANSPDHPLAILSKSDRAAVRQSLSPMESDSCEKIMPAVASGVPTKMSGERASDEIISPLKTEAAPVVADHEPVLGDTVTVRDLPPGGQMAPARNETNPFEEQFEEELAKRSAGAYAKEWQDARDPGQTPPSTLVPSGPVIDTGVVESAPPASGTPSFRDYTAQAGSGPPDTDMAAGLSYIITDYNSYFRIFNKAGTKQGSDVSFYTFFSGGSTPNCGDLSNNVCDPQMVYDDQNDRFVFTCLAVTSTTSYICIAATQTGDPRGTWNKYEISPYATTLADYPHTAIGEDAIFIGTNNFTMAGVYQNSAIVAVQKTNLYAGTALTPRSSTLGTGPYNPRPVVRRGYNQGQYPPPGQAQYFAVNNSANAATIWQWPQPTFTSNPAIIGGGWTDANPGTATNPAEAAYTNLAIDALATKIMDAEIRWPKLWFVRTGLNGSSRDVIRWAEVNMTTGAPVTVQSGTLGATNAHLWMPDCTIDKNNSMAMVFTQAGVTPTIFVGSYITGHDSAGTPTPTGTMEAIQTSKAGLGVYTGVTQSGRYRWGDYLGCQIDPNGCDIWINGMYSDKSLGTSNKEATWVQKWSFADCVPGCTRLAVMDSLAYQCHRSVTATITDTAGTGSCPAVNPSNAVYHSTTGADYPPRFRGRRRTSPSPPRRRTSSAPPTATTSGSPSPVTTAQPIPRRTPRSAARLNVCTTSVDPLTGGCDGDPYMDRNETLNVNVAMTNSEGFDLPSGFTGRSGGGPRPPRRQHHHRERHGVLGRHRRRGAAPTPAGKPFQIRYTGSGTRPDPVLLQGPEHPRHGRLLDGVQFLFLHRIRQHERAY